MTSVDVYVFQEDASAAYRLTWPAEALQAQGADIRIYREGDAVTRDDADVIVMNRPVHPLQAEIVEALTAAGRRVVVDVDDSYGYLSPRHGVYGVWGDQVLKRACKAATAVTVTTPELLRQYGYGHGAVVPNRVPERYLSTRRTLRHDGLWAGWYGSLSAHPDDLQVTGGGVGRALREAGADLCFVGAKSEAGQVKRLLGHKGLMHMGGYYSLSMMPEAIAVLDVGIVPLAGTLFNESKSGLKGMEMAACGVPFVASPTFEYSRLAALGIGQIARQPNEWRREVARLLRDADWRAERAEAGREAMSGQTIEGHAGEWWDAWTVRPTS